MDLIPADVQQFAGHVEIKTLDQFPGYYITRTGSVISTRPRGNAIQNSKPHYLKPDPLRNGYLQVSLWHGNKVVKKTIHALVCEAFHGAKPSENSRVAHADDNKLNNDASNLRWATRLENAQDAILNEKMPKGSSHGSAKLTDDLVREIKMALKNGAKGSQIAKDLNLHHSTIYAIKSGKNWSHIN